MSRIARPYRLFISLALVGAIIFVLFRVVPVNSTTAALALLLAVLGIATAFGLFEAIVSSLAAMLGFNFFFLPPIRTFTISDPQNWVALLAFLATATVASKLSDNVRKREREARERQYEMERLYELSRALMLTSSGERLISQISGHIARIFSVDGVAFFNRLDGEVYRAGERDVPATDARLSDVAVQGTVVQDSKANLIMVPVSLGGSRVGSLAILGGHVSETAVHAAANLAAIALEKERVQEVATQSEAARRNEQLKSVLLDALAHEFKTPLTSIKAAATALLAEDSQTPSQHELLSVVNEETDRLNELISEAIQMARIEAGSLQLKRYPTAVADLIESALEAFRASNGDRSITLDAPDSLPKVDADSELVRLVLRQIVGNALKYSPAGSPIEVKARVDATWMVITVIDHGPGIQEHEMPRIFEKFYRGRDARDSVPGTGMGLAIANEIVQAHGGKIWVQTPPGGGAEFSCTLPVAPVETLA